MAKKNNIQSLFSEEDFEQCKPMPFKGFIVSVVGTSADYTKKSQKELLASLGAVVKDSPVRECDMIFKLSEPSKTDAEKIEKSIYHGYAPTIYGLEDLEKIQRGIYYPYTETKNVSKSLKVKAEHYERNKISMDYVSNVNGILMSNPLVGKEVFCADDVPGNKDVLAQLFGFLGVYFNGNTMYDDIDTILLTEATIGNLYAGNESEDLKKVESFYNNSPREFFVYNFVTLESVLRYVKERATLLHDVTLENMYNSYMNSI